MATNHSQDQHHVSQDWPMGGRGPEFSWHVNHVTGYRPGKYHGTELENCKKRSQHLFEPLIRLRGETMSRLSLTLSSNLIKPSYNIKSIAHSLKKRLSDNKSPRDYSKGSLTWHEATEKESLWSVVWWDDGWGRGRRVQAGYLLHNWLNLSPRL